MRAGTTETGFAFEYDETNLDDFRFVDLLVEIQSANTPDFRLFADISKLLSLMLGEEQKAALYAHIGAKHGGRVPIAEVEAALEDIMTKNC